MVTYPYAPDDLAGREAYWKGVEDARRARQREIERSWVDAERVLGISGGRREVEYELEVARWNPLLSANERRALECRFGVDGAREMSLAEVGSVCGCSVEEASMLIVGALKKIKPTAMPDHSDARRCRACGRDFWSYGWWHEPPNRTIAQLRRQGVCSRRCQLALGVEAVR